MYKYYLDSLRKLQFLVDFDRFLKYAINMQKSVV